MQLLKLFLSMSLLLFAFTLSGCQGNNSDPVDINGSTTVPQNDTLPSTIPDTNTTIVTVVLPTSSAILRTNKQVVTIDVRVFDSANNPYSSGTITKVNPSSVLNGRDIGTFDKISSSIVNGVASFSYTAPANLAADTSTLTFAFYHSSDLSKLKVFTMSIVPDLNQTILTSYELKTSTPDDVNINLENTKTLSYTVYNKNGTALPDTQMKKLTVTSLNPSLVILADSTGGNGASLNIINKNNFTVNFVSNTKSGLVPIKVDAIFNDENEDEQNLSKIFNIVVLSGAPTAMSLSYVGTSQNSDYAKFIENWALTVTDKYNNLVNTSPAISMGAIIGYTKSSATTANVAEYLYYDATAKDGNLTDANPDTFTSTKSAFSNVDLVNDKLVLFGGEGYLFNAFGKWDINAVTSSSELELVDDYSGTAVSGLTYAVGHNFRNEVCNGSPRVANVYAKDGNNTLGSNGSMIIQIEYDYYLVGKSIVLWTNLVGENNNTAVKIGLGRKSTLRGSGLTGGSYSFSKGYTGVRRLLVTISDTVEYYQNANFGYTVEISGDGNTFEILGSSMNQNITSCVDGNGGDTGGVAYVDVNITDNNSSGVLKLTNVLPRQEF